MVLTLNRPGQMNAMTEELERELHEALPRAAGDDSVRVIVLTGAGSAFSAGYDLGDDKVAGGPRRRDVLRHWWDSDTATPGRHLAIMRLPKPVIAAVNGWCLGGGLWYALCADITIASDRAVFGQPEVREIQNSTSLFATLAARTPPAGVADKAFQLACLHRVLHRRVLRDSPQMTARGSLVQDQMRAAVPHLTKSARRLAQPARACYQSAWSSCSWR